MIPVSDANLAINDAVDDETLFDINATRLVSPEHERLLQIQLWYKQRNEITHENFQVKFNYCYLLHSNKRIPIIVLILSRCSYIWSRIVHTCNSSYQLKTKERKRTYSSMFILLFCLYKLTRRNYRVVRRYFVFLLYKSNQHWVSIVAKSSCIWLTFINLRFEILIQMNFSSRRRNATTC